MPHNNNTH